MSEREPGRKSLSPLISPPLVSPPLISIVINNHNYGRFLAQAIDSALAQDYPAVEVVVVDDGSTDDSRAVIAGYGERILPVLQENGGQGAAVNAGFLACSGQIVNFLDSDDRLHPGAARRAAAALAAPDMAHFMARPRLVDGRGLPLGRPLTTRPLPEGDLRPRLLAYGPWAYTIMPMSANWFPRWYLQRILPMPDPAEFRLGADDYLIMPAPLYGFLASSPRAISDYRIHDANHYWRDRLGLADLESDARAFDRMARLLQTQAGRLGIALDPSAWIRRDWRQQWRRHILALAGKGISPPSADLLLAVLRDQTRPWKKALLLPLMAGLLLLPKPRRLGMGLRLLARI